MEQWGVLRIYMWNVQGKLPDHAAAAAAGRNHTQETWDVVVVSIQVLLTAKPWAEHWQGLSLLLFFTTI